MDYFVTCECGKRLPVTAALAGSAIQCACKRSIDVPRLSELRQTAGQGAFEAGIVDKIQRMIAEGALPSERRCALSGDVTSDTLNVWIECERKWVHGPDEGHWNFDAIVCHFLHLSWLRFLLNRTFRKDQPEEVGRDITIVVPLRIRRIHHSRVMRFNQRKLRHLLATERVYAELLEEYPEAKLLIAEKLA